MSLTRRVLGPTGSLRCAGSRFRFGDLTPGRLHQRGVFGLRQAEGRSQLLERMGVWRSARSSLQVSDATPTEPRTLRELLLGQPRVGSIRAKQGAKTLPFVQLLHRPRPSSHILPPARSRAVVAPRTVAWPSITPRLIPS
jgi:hypothetical protein